MSIFNAHDAAAPAAAASAALASAPAVGRERPLGTSASIVVTSGGEGPATAAVFGELDMAGADGLAGALCCALDEYAPGVLLDLAGVEFFDCAALHAIERARRHAERTGRHLILERTSAAVDLLLDMVEHSAW